jgi:ubiquinone/menaquinone biosynthesis C-methylase UbiE
MDLINDLKVKEALDEDSPILDVGCGRGRLLVALEKMGITKITGVDVSDGAVKYAKDHAKSATVLVADIVEGLPLPDSSFGLVTDLTMVSSLHPRYWPKIYREFKRLLKPNGYLISEMFIQSPDKPLSQSLIKESKHIPEELDQIYGVTREGIRSILGEFFEIVKVQESHPDSLGRYFILAQKKG